SMLFANRGHATGNCGPGFDIGKSSKNSIRNGQVREKHDQTGRHRHRQRQRQTRAERTERTHHHSERISPGYERHILQEEESPLQALDVMVYSPKLKKKNQRYFVGLLASEDQDNAELEDTDNKATSDQALIVALTALAYAAAVSGPSQAQPQPAGGFVSADEAEYIIGTGLPVRTFAQFHRTFEERLVGEHEVT